MRSAAAEPTRLVVEITTVDAPPPRARRDDSAPRGWRGREREGERGNEHRTERTHQYLLLSRQHDDASQSNRDSGGRHPVGGTADRRERDSVNERVETWMAALEARQLADLTFPEVSRSLRALSSTYVERRAKLKEGAALAGAGKRAAFALFYGPLHFLLVQHIVARLGRPFTTIESVVDLGCGTGAAGAGWATACATPPRVMGIDRHPWAIDEARRTCADLGVRATFRVDDLTHVTMAGQPSERGKARGATRGAPPPNERGHGVLLAFAVNEIADDAERHALRTRLLAHAGAGGRVLIVEPLAGFVAPWWQEWQDAFAAAGGRADEWRVHAELPPIVEKLDRAAGLNHRELKGRSLSI